MNTEEKLVITRQLLRLNVDVIEAGFPVSSPGDFKRSGHREGSRRRRHVVCGLTRAVDKDIDVRGRLPEGCRSPRIHTGIGVSPEHLQDKLHRA
jgi:2-isopropylmalate synthase